MSRHERGLGIIELSLVLCLAALLCGSATWALNGSIKNRQLKNTADMLVAALERLQLEALQSEAAIHLDIQPTGYLARKRKVLFLQQTLPHHFQFEDGSTRLISFLPTGVTSPATLRLSDGKKTCLIITSLRGRVRRQCLH